MSYEEESRILLEKHKQEYNAILEKYKEQDKKYYENNPRILDGKAPSYEELEKCKNKFNQDLKELKNKYNK